MRKHDSFRAALIEAFPDLVRDPQALAIYIDRGRIASRFGPAGARATTGFEWRYNLTAILLDFTGDTNRLALAVLDWIRAHQPERLQNHTTGEEAFAFQVDVLDDKTVDIEITLELNEAVDIDQDGTPAYRAEPVLEEDFEGVPAGTDLDAITINGEGLLP